jgi:hypothetical protein
MPTANAGTDRTAFVNETLALDGTGSTGAFDGLQLDGRHSIQWDLGYGGWTYEGGLTCPIAYPKAGTYTVTLTIYDASGASSSDTATVTVSAITEGTETTISDSGNAITNGTNLKAAITAAVAVNNPVITIMAGVTYDFDGTAYPLPNRTGTGYCTIRTSGYASLPGGTNRISPNDSSNLAIITPGDHAITPTNNSAEAAFTAPMGSTPGHHYRFLGIHFAKKFPAGDYGNPSGFFDFGAGGATALTQLPHHLQIDRCFIDGGDTTHLTTRGVACRASDSAVVNCYIYRIQMTGSDVQAVWIGMGERLAVINNFLSATTENMMAGGADVGIYLETGTAQSTGNDATHIKLAAGASAVDDYYVGKGIFIFSGTGATVSSTSNPGVTIIDYNGTTKIATVSPAWATTPDGTSVYRIGEHVPTDVVVRRNYMWKDPNWRSGAAGYYGVNWNVKNIFEVKQGRRWSVQGNIMQNHWQEDQNWAITLTVKNQDAKQPWSTIQYLDFAYNKVLDVGNGFQLLSGDYAWPSLGSNDWLLRHNVLSGVSAFGGFHNFCATNDGGTTDPDSYGDKIRFVRNSSDATGTSGQGRMFLFESTTKFTNFVLYGNIAQGEFQQTDPPITGGQAAIIAATGGGSGSYSATKNGFFQPGTGNPADNTATTNVSTVLYTDIANHDLTLLAGSPFLTTGPAGGRAGADISTVDTLTSGTVTGLWEEAPGGTVSIRLSMAVL